jgi:MSHA biogenesis protein MshL
MIDEYIEQTIKDASKQVLIEAQIMEVVLTDANAYGINWQSNSGRYGFNLLGDILGTQQPIGIFTSRNSNKVFEFIATQGRIESLGNPRIRVLNGQSAMITSGQLNPFWEKKVENDTEADTQTITYERSTVLDGITLGVTANVMEDNKITLHVVPILSSIEEIKYQYELDAQGNSYSVASYPKVNMKEAGTILTVPNGSTIIMGGLITNKDTMVERKVPLLSSIPGLGLLFKAKSSEKEKRELVIMITTTLIDG